MDSAERVSQEKLELEIAKTRLRLAAERAEPARLIRQGVQSAPLGAVATATAAGVVLAFLRGRKGDPDSFAARLVDLAAPLVAAAVANPTKVANPNRTSNPTRTGSGDNEF